MKTLTAIFSIVILLVSSQLSGQTPRCGLDGVNTAQSIAPPAAVVRQPGQIFVIPVVVHVVHYSSDLIGSGSNISDAQVLSGIAELNNIFRNTNNLSVDMEMEFCLAKQKPDGSLTNGIDRISFQYFPIEGQNNGSQFIGPVNSSLTQSEIDFYTTFGWDQNEYLNIWVSPNLHARSASPGNISGLIYGMSNIPSVSPFTVGTWSDGVWIINQEFGTIGTAFNSSNGWLAHETGHYFNLKHPSDALCLDLDQLLDTPIYQGSELTTLSQNPNYVCGTLFTPTCNPSQPFIPDLFMIGWVEQDFDRCFVRFTPDQKTEVELWLGLRSQLFFIKGEQSSTKCGCQSLTNTTSPYTLNDNFNVGKNSLGTLYSPFDQSYAALNNWNSPSNLINFLSVGSGVSLFVNNSNATSNLVGDFSTQNYVDVIDGSAIVDWTLDGQRLELLSGSSLKVGDAVSIPETSGNIILECTSLLELKSGSVTQLFSQSRLLIKKGGTLLVRSGATLELFDQSMIIVEEGGFICVESGASIVLANSVNVISISPQATLGVNPSLNLVTNCGSSIAFNGLGSVTCYSANFTDPNGVQINSGGTTLWNSSRSIKGVVYVSNNSTLVISGTSTVIEFADTRAVGQWTTIIVDRGSKLIVENGAVLKGNTECNTMWDGIQVWGNRNAPQIPINSSVQGQVIIRSGGTIMDAYEGVSLFRTDQFGNIDWSYTGGIVMAKDANFINCGRAVNFLSYRSGNSNNVSYFYNCHFVTNGRLNNPLETPRSFVSMFDVKGASVALLRLNLRKVPPSKGTHPCSFPAVSIPTKATTYCKIIRSFPDCSELRERS
jgi:hypothetical protein